jgi:hypothetical protein
MPESQRKRIPLSDLTKVSVPSLEVEWSEYEGIDRPPYSASVYKLPQGNQAAEQDVFLVLIYDNTV